MQIDRFDSGTAIRESNPRSFFFFSFIGERPRMGGRSKNPKKAVENLPAPTGVG